MLIPVQVIEGVSRIEAYIFLRKMHQYENKPEIVVDKAYWYPWALDKLGLKYKLNLQ